MNRSRGFTLLEMMIVIAIIAILATLAVPSYLGSVARDQIVESLKLVEPLKEKVDFYYRNTGTLPSDNLDAGIPSADKLLGNFVTSIELQRGAFTITFGNKAVKALQGKLLTVRAITVVGSPDSPPSWVCGGSAVPVGMQAADADRTTIKPVGLLPMNCRSIDKPK